MYCIYISEIINGGVNLNIIDSKLAFRGSLPYGNAPEMIILHHAAAVNCSINDIHNWHLGKGWVGCGYHYLVRKDGSIYAGRDEKTAGAHCLGYNTISIGICAEGNFELEAMGEAQHNSLWQLICYICIKYGINKIYGHRELNPTDCPGNKYPLNRIKAAAGILDKTSYPGYLLKMKPGVCDENVRLIQRKLIEKRYSVGSCGADSYFGRDTLEGVKRFQRDSGLEVDGIVGIKTWGELMGS